MSLRVPQQPRLLRESISETDTHRNRWNASYETGGATVAGATAGGALCYGKLNNVRLYPGGARNLKPAQTKDLAILATKRGKDQLGRNIV